MNLLLISKETERLRFRKLLPSDFQTWLPFHQDPRSSQYWEGVPKNPKTACREQFEWLFENYEKGSGVMNALTLKTTGELIGLCGLSVRMVDNVQELEIGYSLLSKYRQKGYAIEAAKKCKEYAFRNNLAESLISIIQVDNLPSQKVAFNNGMVVDKTTLYNNNRVHIFRIKA